jgi:hypothetical protein
MRSDDAKPNTPAHQHRMQLSQHPDRGQIEVGRVGKIADDKAHRT